MTTPITIRRALSAVAAAALGLSLTACSALSPDSSSSTDSRTAGGAEGALPVAVSFYPIQYLTEAIGGDHVSVTSLTPADQEPTTTTCRARRSPALWRAPPSSPTSGLQPSLDKAVTQVNGPTVVDLSSKVDLKHHEGVEDEEEHADESADEGAHKEADHDADSLDPHFLARPGSHEVCRHRH